jgi:hypothetical protein
VTANVAVALPAGTVTVAGTVAAALLLDRDSTVPPVGAVFVRVTVPVDEFPPATLVGLTDTLDSAVDGVTVSVAVWLTPL